MDDGVSEFDKFIEASEVRDHPGTLRSECRNDGEAQTSEVATQCGASRILRVKLATLR